MSELLKNPVLKNTQTGQIVELISSPFTIGRALGCDYVTENKITSRKHCQLTKTEQGWTLTDLSTNGTLINVDIHIKNGETSVPLQHKDSINIGDIWEFLTKGEPPESVDRVSRVRDTSPLPSPSFDENGVSDELLLNLVDRVEQGLQKPNQQSTITNLVKTYSENVASTSVAAEGIPIVPNERNTGNSTKQTNDSLNSASNSVNVLPTTHAAVESNARIIIASSNVLPCRSNAATESFISPENPNKRIKIVTNPSAITSPITAIVTPSTSAQNTSQICKIGPKVVQVTKLTPEQVKVLKESGKCLFLRPTISNTNTTSSEPSTTRNNEPGGCLVVRPNTIVLNQSETSKNIVIAANNGENTSNIPVTSIQIITPKSHVPSSNSTLSGGNSKATSAHVTNVLVAVNEVVVETTDESSKTKVHESQEPGPSKEAKLQSRFEEDMEDELLCTICANLFIRTVTLSCSHSFCEYCINTWKAKKSDCPICRNKITSTTRTLVLDNLINKIVETGSDEIKNSRKQALAEREKIEKEIEDKKTEAANKRTNTARRGRGNRARGSSRTVATNNSNANPATNTNNPPVVQAPPPAAFITITDSPSTTDSDNTDDDDDYYDYGSEGWHDDYENDEWYNGVPGAYYGGYGSCFICGDRGHWANGCPNR